MTVVVDINDRIAQLTAQIAAVKAQLEAEAAAVEPVAEPEPVCHASYMGGIDMGPVPSPTEVEAPPAVGEPKELAEPKNIGLTLHLDRRNLLWAATTAAKAVSARCPIPVLACLRIEANDGELTVTGTDLDTTIQASIDTGAGNYFNGVGLAPAKLLIDTLKGLDENRVRLNIDPEGRCEVGPTTLTGMKLADYPALTIPPKGDSTIILTVEQSAELVGAIHAVAAAASEDNARPVLTGVIFESEGGKLRLVATDSYRMAWYDTGIPFSQDDMRPSTGRKGGKGYPDPWLIPAKVLVKMAGIMLPDCVTFDPKGAGTARFDGQGITLVTRLVEGTFPNYRQLIPNESVHGYTTITVPEEQLLRVFKTIKPIVEDRIPVRLHFDHDSLIVKATRQDVGGTELPVPESTVNGYSAMSDGDLIAAYNLRYLRDGILAGRTEAKAKGGISIITVPDPLKPAVVRVGGGAGLAAYRYLTMPVRI